MSENRLIPVADLLIDERNPRLSTVDAGQRTSLHDLAEHEAPKLLALAESIAEHGLNPAELPIVRPDRTKPGRYIVVEGNRRLCVLQILENPAILTGSVSPAMMRRFTAASKIYASNPVTKVLCSVITDRDEYRYWVLLKHTGENNGAGVSPWGPLQKSRFDGTPAPYRELLERLVSERLVSESIERKIKVTNFQRIVETAGVRQLLGYSFQDGRVKYHTPWRVIAKTLVHIVKALENKTLNVNKIRTAEQRVAYVTSAMTTAPKRADADKKGGKRTGRGKQKEEQGKDSRPRPHARPTLIPDDCFLRVQGPRIQNIESELRRLAVEQYPNAVAIMLRVFLELSVDSYISSQSVSVHPDSKLAHRLSACLKNMETLGHLADRPLRAVRAAVQSGTFLATSVTTMNDFIHNPHMSPSPGDLRAGWDKLQPLFKAFWPAI